MFPRDHPKTARLVGNGRRKVNSGAADVPAIGIAKFGLSLMTRPRISRYYYYVGVVEVGAAVRAAGIECAACGDGRRPQPFCPLCWHPHYTRPYQR